MTNSWRTPVARVLVRCGMTANFLTAIGLILALTSAWMVLRRDLFLAGGFLLLSGLFDMLDGAVARERGTSDRFGGILDSSLDRYGDGAVLGAMIILNVQWGQLLFAVAGVSALLGSFAISYVRARAECEVEDCRVGFWERGERLVVLALSLILGNPGASLCVLALGTHWSVFQRLAYARRQTRTQRSQDVPLYLRVSKRGSATYFLKVAILLVLLLFWRPA